MVSSLFSIRDAIATDGLPSNETSARNPLLREYIAGPENGLLRKLVDWTLAPNRPYNPILLHGPTGVGKSHLLRELVAGFHDGYPASDILLMNGSEFSQSLVQAIELDSIDDVRGQHRGCDLFVLDDLQELANKRHAQQELLHTCDALLRRDALILLSSRVAPAELPFGTGLNSRLTAGLVIPVRPPDGTTHATLVRRLAQELHIDLSDEAIAVITNNGTKIRSVPELSGLLIHLRQTVGERVRIDAQLVKQLLDECQSSPQLTARQIIKQAARYFGLKLTDLTGPSRRQTTALARGIAIYLIRHATSESFEQIGRRFGNRDHTTVLHAFRRIDKNKSDPLVQIAIEELTRRLGVTIPISPTASDRTL